MSSVLPGKPRSSLQGLTTGCWDGKHISAYISGGAFTILSGSQTILQTIYDDSDEPLESITFDEATGKIATCTATQIRVYKPFGHEHDALKWAQEAVFDNPHADTDAPCALSWGGSEELLVASNTLSLFSTKGEPVCSWSKKLPNEIKSASISYDAAYIASIGRHDRLVKVWRRLTYGQNEVRFDVTYLRHPDLVTGIRWRRPIHVEAATENVLYTFCLDNFVRIWTPTDTAEGQRWQLWGRVNLCASTGDGGPSPGVWLAFIVDGRDFTASVERAVRDRMADDSSTDDVALDHLVAIANRNPEICVAIDKAGVLSAWALENVCSDTASKPKIFDVAQVRSRQFETLGFLSASQTPHIEIQTYCDKSLGVLNILMHSFDGRIGVFASNVADLFDPTTNEQRLLLQTIWAGHSSSIRKIVRNYSGRIVVSRTENGENIVWKHTRTKADTEGTTLSRQSTITEKDRIYRICVIRKGRFVIFLKKEALSLWDCREERAVLLDETSYNIEGNPLCLIVLPRPRAKDYRTAHIATVDSHGTGIVWQVSLPAYFDDPSTDKGASISEFCRFSLEDTDELAYVLPVDPAGSSPVMSGFLDVFARDVAVSYTRSGRVSFWTARVNMEKQVVEWLSTCSTETGLTDPPLASGSTLRKAALVNASRSQVTIWDIGGSRLEFNEDYESTNTIQDLDWTSTPDSQSILAVGFQYRVLVLAQMRFDYLNKGPAWAAVREISIRELTPHPIGDSTWLGDGFLVIGAGHQMFIHDRRVSVAESLVAKHRLPHHKNGSWDLFEAVQRFNGPLPVFHPQFLSQCILSGKSTLVRRILVALHRTLKYFIAGETMDNYLGLPTEDFYTTLDAIQGGRNKNKHAYVNGGDSDGDDEDEVFGEDSAAAINEKLTKIGIPQLSGHEQIQLADIIECSALVERHRRSMDENGARFMLFFRQHALHKGRRGDMSLSWREINWAYHSISQDILVDFVSRQNHGAMLWDHARESGLFMWLTDISAVKAQFEAVARNEYTKGDTKNPVDCSIFYLALRKKAVLQGLWRMATGNKEQTATKKFLANNFDDPKWRTAALKNAYALLSKRRFEYAAAFFLLADNLAAAADVCINQLKDVQLAVAISRVYEGDEGPVLRKILHDDVLPLAAQEGNRWLASWAFWMLRRKDMAVRALITPVYTLLETPCSPDINSRLFLTDDPALVVLYSQLRQKTLQTLRGASKVTPKAEWEFVLHSAKLYDRMGCDMLGLDLIRNWEFQHPTPNGLGGGVNPLKLLRRRSSLVVDDLPPNGLQRGLQQDKAGPRVNAPPTTFEEPDAGSLLDSFGF